MKKETKNYIIQIIIALLAGGLSALLTGKSFMTYDTMIKPPFAPPELVFPIVWTILFTLMGISAAISKNTAGRIPFSYWLQLFVNIVWPLIFFNMQAYLFAFIWLLLLAFLIIVMIYDFYKINKTAAILQLPYLLWTVFAGVLTLSVVILNG